MGITDEHYVPILLNSLETIVRGVDVLINQSTGSNRWVTLRPAVVSTARIWSGVSHLWTEYLEPQGSIPLTLTLLGGVRFIAWRLRRPFLGECRHIWAKPLHLDTPQKRSCATLVRMVGGSTNIVDVLIKKYTISSGLPSSRHCENCILLMF